MLEIGIERGYNMKVEYTPKEKVVLLFKIILTTFILYFLFKYCLKYVYPFVLAYGVAKLLYPIVRWFYTKWKIPKCISGIIALALFCGVLLTIFYYLGGALFEQLKAFLTNLPVYRQMLWGQMAGICQGCDDMFGMKAGTAQEYILSNTLRMEQAVSENIIPEITEQALNICGMAAGICMVIGITIVMSFMIMLEMEKWQAFYRNSIFYKDICAIGNPLRKVGIAYFKTQFILMSLVAIVCAVGLFLTGNEYSILFGVLIAIFDAFPILGSGIILIPWAIYEIIVQNMYRGAILLTVYLVCQLMRQFLEPKLMGKKIGIHPIAIFMAIFVGIQLFGIVGVILGPISVVIIVTVTKEYFISKE